MKAIRIAAAVSVPALLLILVFAQSAKGQDSRPHKLGDHPAVVVQRLYKSAGYDYASKFYPHPAWLHLYAAQPHDDADSTAVADGATESERAPAPLSVAHGDAAPAKPLTRVQR
jgi:hypothetical protein